MEVFSQGPLYEREHGALLSRNWWSKLAKYFWR